MEFDLGCASFRNTWFFGGSISVMVSKSRNFPKLDLFFTIEVTRFISSEVRGSKGWEISLNFISFIFFCDSTKSYLSLLYSTFLHYILLVFFWNNYNVYNDNEIKIFIFNHP